jgi:replicative DNA helicase
MILAYITGITETKFRYGNFSSKEEKVISQAIDLMGEFKDNLYIVRMPNPTIEGVKTIVRENCLTKDIKYVFYDYIFISPSMLQEFKGFGLRNDEVLLMFATALKDLAVELGVFVMSSTQLNANGDNNQNIRNEAALAGGRATINKADVGAIIARPTKEELETFMEDGNIPFIPNMVTDIYKVRSGQYTQVRIWSSVELGTLRKQDLFVTDAHLDVIPINYSGVKVENWDSDYSNYLSERVRKLNE